MAVSYPTSVKSFSDIVDGTNYVEADQMNQAYDEIEAVESLVGALGYAANQTDSLTSVLREYRHGCKVIADTVAQIKVNAGEVVCVDSSGNKKLRRNTSQTTVTWANIDTGAEAASKRYYVHAVADAIATTFTVEISLSATAPDGVTTFKLLGSFYNNSSSNITDVMDDLHLLHKEPGTMQAWPTTTAPAGAILCDGAATVGTTVDPTLTDLFGVIGTAFGGSDATDFQVPDLRGRAVVGLDNMGQGSADRITAAAADSIGGAAGVEEHVLTEAEMPSHDHPLKVGTSGSTTYSLKLEMLTQETTSDYVNDTGSDNAHTNVQPYIALSVIIWK